MVWAGGIVVVVGAAVVVVVVGLEVGIDGREPPRKYATLPPTANARTIGAITFAGRKLYLSLVPTCRLVWRC